MMAYLLGSEIHLYQGGAAGEPAGKGLLWRVHHRFNALFERLRFRYIGLLEWSLRHRGPVLAAFTVISVASLGLAGLVGDDATTRRLVAAGRYWLSDLSYKAIFEHAQILHEPDRLGRFEDIRAARAR